MPTPVWQGASAGYMGVAGQVSQFLGTHSASYVYNGNGFMSGQTTGSGLYLSTASQYLAQEITTGSAQSAIGTVHLQVSAVGGSPVTSSIAPLTVSLYASSAGLPTGAPLATTSLGEQYVYTGPFLLTIPLVVTGLTPSTAYQIVAAPAGDSSAYYALQRSNQTAGAATSPDGANWTQQAYGLMYEVFDYAGTSGPPLFIFEDGGARLTQLTYNAAGALTGIAETTAVQGGGYLYCARTLTYSAGQPIGVD